MVLYTFNNILIITMHLRHFEYILLLPGLLFLDEAQKGMSDAGLCHFMILRYLFASLFSRRVPPNAAQAESILPSVLDF